MFGSCRRRGCGCGAPRGFVSSSRTGEVLEEVGVCERRSDGCLKAFFLLDEIGKTGERASRGEGRQLGGEGRGHRGLQLCKLGLS